MANKAKERGQIGGVHYGDMMIDVIEFCHVNNIPFNEGSAIKYISRWRLKGGIQDLEKAKNFIDRIIQLEKKYDKKN